MMERNLDSLIICSDVQEGGEEQQKSEGNDGEEKA